MSGLRVTITARFPPEAFTADAEIVHWQECDIQGLVTPDGDGGLNAEVTSVHNGRLELVPFIKYEWEMSLLPKLRSQYIAEKLHGKEGVA